VEALLAYDAIRFANQVHAWIEVEDGRITSYGMPGQARLGSTTVRLRSRGLTFAGVALPDLTPPPRVLKDRAARLGHRHADPARRRDLRRPARRRQPVSPPLPV
jgi:hypothetical protein